MDEVLGLIDCTSFSSASLASPKSFNARRSRLICAQTSRYPADLHDTRKPPSTGMEGLMLVSNQMEPKLLRNGRHG